MLANIAKYLRPQDLRFYMQMLMALPALFMIVKMHKSFGDNYVLDYIQNGETEKVKKFIIKSGEKKINKYYYRMLDHHTFERHTLLTAAIHYEKPEIVKFLLGFPKIDLRKQYIFSESSFNHREYDAVQLVTKFKRPEIAQMVKDFQEGRFR
ncbi:hypothetical protein AAIR98_000221 [Elusimicrobium simillimum]|uniref:hypothetical protein n=1 Tax=Elusimicrobium simillimum TaxID=3143438 RepID=UPI003C6EC2D5